LPGENRFIHIPEVRELKLNEMNINENEINISEVNRSWAEQKGKLKMRFGYLTDNKSFFEEGNKEKIIGRLQVKLGKTKYELPKIIESH
jgi:uncharacterized protein YjbJ (UPF0337 family)